MFKMFADIQAKNKRFSQFILAPFASNVNPLNQLEIIQGSIQCTYSYTWERVYVYTVCVNEKYAIPTKKHSRMSFPIHVKIFLPKQQQFA